MPRVAVLDLVLTDDVRDRALEFLESVTEYVPTLCLLKSRTDGEPEEHLGLAAYTPENVAALAPDYERLGYTLLYSVAGLTIAIPQAQLVEELRGKTLALRQGRLVTLERHSGI